MLEDQQASNKNGLHRKERFEIGVQDAVGYQKVLKHVQVRSGICFICFYSSMAYIGMLYRNCFPRVSHVVYY